MQPSWRREKGAVGPQLTFREDVRLAAGEARLVDTGVCMLLPPGYYAELWSTQYAYRLNVKVDPAIVRCGEAVSVRLTNGGAEEVTIPANCPAVVLVCKPAFVP